jgi:hypothetical protein
VRTDSESYLVSVYRCPTRLPKREGHKEQQEGEEEGEQQDYPLPPGGYDGPPEMMYEGGPGLRRKKMSFQIGKKKEIHPKKTLGLPMPSSDLTFCSEPGKILILINFKIFLCYSFLWYRPSNFLFKFL